MRVYFVRHGESEENVAQMYQGGHSLLTPLGEEQARFVAERFMKIPVDIILSSNMVRAKETARIIGERIGQSVSFSELLREATAPSELFGKNLNDPETATLRDKWFTKRGQGEDHRFSDEESVGDLKKRAREALAFITARKANDVLVVTHGTFLRVMAGIMLLGDDFSSKLFNRFREVFSISNTGITVCEYEDGERNSDTRWRVITWNDHAHLG